MRAYDSDHEDRIINFDHMPKQKTANLNVNNQMRNNSQNPQQIQSSQTKQ